jgi:hypothetical protein
MTRFRADSSDAREELFADAIAAHRARGSPFCTFEAEAEAETEGERGNEDGGVGPPWIQFGDTLLNLDCTDEEFDRLEALLEEFPAFTIERLTRPEDAEGTNVRVQAFGDDERIATFVDRCFRAVYGRSEGYTAWVTEV